MEYDAPSRYYSPNSAPHQQVKPLSCAECRRAKLRCDRRFPCETCRKRGLEHLCPTDALITRSKTLVADSESLRQENLRLQERIRQLEGALMSLQARFIQETRSQAASDFVARGENFYSGSNIGRHSSTSYQ